MMRPKFLRALAAAASVIAAAAIVGVGRGPAAARQAPDPLEQLFERGRAAQKSMRSLRASFRETTVSALLVKPMTSTGTIVAAVNPIRLVMQYAPPNARTVWIDERVLAVKSPSRPAIEEIDIAATQRRIQKYFTDASLDDLRSSFTLELGSDPSEPAAHLLEMTPRRKQIKEGLDRLRLWIDKERLLMVRLEMHFPGGDSTRIDLSDIELNVPIDERTFARPGRGGRP